MNKIWCNNWIGVDESRALDQDGLHLQLFSQADWLHNAAERLCALVAWRNVAQHRGLRMLDDLDAAPCCLKMIYANAARITQDGYVREHR